MLILQVHVKHSSLKKEVYNPQAFIPHAVLLRQAFRPLRKIPHCCLPQESGPCLSPSVADHSLKPAMDRRLGKPLPYQLANPIQAHLVARGPKIPRFPPQSLCGISVRFHTLSPTTRQVPIHYSPVRHSSATSKLVLLPFDLHVLGMPPAFNLSHDQTLQFNYFFCDIFKMPRTHFDANRLLKTLLFRVNT